MIIVRKQYQVRKTKRPNEGTKCIGMRICSHAIERS